MYCAAYIKDTLPSGLLKFAAQGAANAAGIKANATAVLNQGDAYEALRPANANSF